MIIVPRIIPVSVRPWLVQESREGVLFSILPRGYFQTYDGDIAKNEIRKMKKALSRGDKNDG